MYLAATESRDDGEFRQRILDYLSEGDLAKQLERLVSSDYNLSDWFDIVDDCVDLGELRELRGATARLLAAYPGHPGLLLARGVTELLDPIGSLEEFRRNIIDSINSTKERHSQDNTVLVWEWLIYLPGFGRDGALGEIVKAIHTQNSSISKVEWLQSAQNELMKREK